MGELTQHRVWWAAIGFALVAIPTLAADPKQPDPREFRSQVELVLVDAVVLDAEGEPVRGLTRDDFTLRDEGVPQAITSFEAVTGACPDQGEQPPSTNPMVATNPPVEATTRSWVIVFDDVHLSTARAAQARVAISKFLESELLAGDRVTLLPTSGGAWWSAPMPAGRIDLERVLQRLEGKRPNSRGGDHIGDFEALRISAGDEQIAAEVLRRMMNTGALADVSGASAEARRSLKALGIDPGKGIVRARAAMVHQEAGARTDATLDALERVLRSLASVRGRKSVILVSEGFVHEVQRGGFRRVQEAAARSNSVVYFLDARGFTGLDTADAEQARVIEEQDIGALLARQSQEYGGAENVALDSGGFSVHATNDLLGGLRRIAGESRDYYLLGYTPAVRLDGRYRKIEVATRRSGVQVRARKGYYAPKDPAAVPPQEAHALRPNVRQALDAPGGTPTIPLRMTNYVFETGTAGKARVLLQVEADPAELAFQPSGERLEDVVEAFVLLTARDTGEQYHQERQLELSLPPDARAQLAQTWLAVRPEFELAPGVYLAHVVVRDRNSDRLGSLVQRFEVPLQQGLRTSTPILTDLMQPGPDGAVHPLPTSNREFAPAGLLYCQFDVYGALPDPATGVPRVSASYQLQRSGADVVSRQGPTPLAPGPQGELSHLLEIDLGNASPGPHRIVLEVQDAVAGRTIQVPLDLVVSRAPA